MPPHNLARFDFLSIRLAVACARTGSLTAAARECRLVVPAASRRLKDLEDARQGVVHHIRLCASTAAISQLLAPLLALQHRHATGAGQVIDVALYEAVFNCMESLLPEYSAFGAVRGPAGSALPGIAPTNAYRCVDGGHALIAGNGDSIFRRLMALIGRDTDRVLREIGLDVAQIQALKDKGIVQ